MELIKQNWIGIVGLIGLCVGMPLTHGVLQNSVNLASFIALVLYAWLGKNEFFIYQQSAVLIGAVLKILQVNDFIIGGVLVAILFVAVIKILQNPVFRVWYTAVGFIGFGGFVYGYSMLNNVAYAVAGVASTIYSFVSYSKGVKSAFLFGVLNIIYGSIALYLVFSS
jgi:hypothetical protein